MREREESSGSRKGLERKGERERGREGERERGREGEKGEREMGREKGPQEKRKTLTLFVDRKEIGIIWSNDGTHNLREKDGEKIEIWRKEDHKGGRVKNGTFPSWKSDVKFVTWNCVDKKVNI
jgi:hypothetical protein